MKKPYNLLPVGISCIFLFSLQLLIAALPTNLNLPDDPFWKEDAEEANNNKNHFVEPADSLNYADYHYVGAHNAHTYHRFFETVRQQDQTIVGMLSYGVRGLMLDTYDRNGFAARGPEGMKIILSHPAPGALAFSQKGHQSYQTLAYELRRVIEFMRANPKAIITIIIENYGDLNQTAKEIQDTTKQANYDPVLKPADWQAKDTPWPTLGWMRNNNKRLVIFSQRGGNTATTWAQFNYMVENNYSTTDESKLCGERWESSVKKNERLLVAMNNFSDLAVTRATRDTKNQVDYTVVKRITTNCKAKGFAKGRLFNSYWADRIVDSCNDLYENKQKTIFEYVNELNTTQKP